MDDRGAGESASGISVLMARQDDDNENIFGYKPIPKMQILHLLKIIVKKKNSLEKNHLFIECSPYIYIYIYIYK